MQGSYFFLDVNTEQLIKRRKFTKLPMPESIIRTVEVFGQRGKQHGRLTFTDQYNEPFGWDADK
jgi:hypothetical protein